MNKKILTPEEEDLFNPLKSERPECRCLRKMLAQGEAMQTAMLMAQSDEEIPSEIKTNVVEYTKKIQESYINLGCLDERIDLLTKRIQKLDELDKQGLTNPNMIKTKARYEMELEKLKSMKGT